MKLLLEKKFVATIYQDLLQLSYPQIVHSLSLEGLLGNKII